MKLRYLAGMTPHQHNDNQKMFFPLPPELESLTPSELRAALPTLPTNDNAGVIRTPQPDQREERRRRRRRRRLLTEKNKEKEDSSDVEIEEEDEEEDEEFLGDHSSELHPPSVPKSLASGRSYSTDIFETSQVIAGGKDSAPIGVDAPRLADLSHWIRNIRKNPNANFAEKFISIPTLLISHPIFPKTCIFNHAKGKKKNEENDADPNKIPMDNFQMLQRVSPKLGEHFTKGGKRKIDKSDWREFAQLPEGRKYMRRVAALENYIRWRLFKEEQILILKDKAASAQMLQESILQSYARSMMNFVKISREIDSSASQSSSRAPSSHISPSSSATSDPSPSPCSRSQSAASAPPPTAARGSPTSTWRS